VTTAISPPHLARTSSMTAVILRSVSLPMTPAKSLTKPTGSGICSCRAMARKMAIMLA
jgi:hypothetical protein